MSPVQVRVRPFAPSCRTPPDSSTSFRARPSFGELRADGECHGRREHRRIHRTGSIVVLLAALSLLDARTARASDDAGTAPVGSEATSGYRAPLAGKPFETTVLGERVVVPERDRSEVLAASVGGIVFSPRVGSERFTPLGSLFVLEIAREARLRASITGVEDEVDAALRVRDLGDDGAGELLFHFENSTAPFSSKVVADGVRLSTSEVYAGSFEGWLGGGVRFPCWPFEVDNDLSVGLSYELGWLYEKRAHGTPEASTLPPDTVVHGAILRARLDCFERNLMELPHLGFALGAKLELARRDRWRAGTPALVIEPRDARDYAKVWGHALFALPIPLLDEHHRFLPSLHAGATLLGNVDRFSAFGVGGGMPPTEAMDLPRNVYAGAPPSVPARAFVLATFEYRYELAFFCYLHARGSVFYGSVPRLRDRARDDSVTFGRLLGESVSAAVTTGFLFDSTFYLEYAYDFALARSSEGGHSVLVQVSKQF